MGQQRGGDAGLVYVPRTSITGNVWDDNGILDAASGTYDCTTGYNGIFDAGERGLAGQKLTVTQWYWLPEPTETRPERRRMGAQHRLRCRFATPPTWSWQPTKPT